MEITITMVGGAHHLVVNPGGTVGTLKNLIQAKLEIPADAQKLTFGGTILSDDSRSLSSYGLTSGSQVFLLVIEPVVIQVFLKNEKGITSTYNIKQSETVSDFKQMVEAREGAPVSQQRLVFQSKEMTTGKLEDYGVEALSTIELTFRLRGG